MPPRLNKRQLREQEELLALAEPSDVEDAPAEDSGSNLRHPTAGAGFAALMGTDHSDADSEQEAAAPSSKSKKARELFLKKKKKKKPAASATPVLSSPPPGLFGTPVTEHAASEAGPSKKEKKALKKQKAKEKKDDRDEVDKALAELSLKYPDLKQSSASTLATPTTQAVSSTLFTLLSVSVQHLDSEAEMRKFFGSKVVSAAKSSAAGSSSRRAHAVQRSTLTRPQQSWWPAQMREGLSSRLLTDVEIARIYDHHPRERIPGERVWTVEYSKKYRGVTLAFMQTVMSGDPEGFNQLIRLLPYHADTLLQLSEVYNHREEYSTGADFIDRALFTYERAFVGSFNFITGMNRLDFDRVENRPFFLALHLIFNAVDPHGVLLHLDFLALKAGMSEWLLEMYDWFAAQAGEWHQNACRFLPIALPGWLYARALALYEQEETRKENIHEKSTAALKEAILAFPAVVPLLADKADIPLPNNARSHSAFRVYTDTCSSLGSDANALLHLLCHLYAQRSFSLWKSPTHSSWLSQTVISTLSSLSPSFSNTTEPYVRFTALAAHPQLMSSVYRHVIVLEASCRRLFSFIPRRVTNAKHLACDPLPPSTFVSVYDEEFFRGAEDALTVHPRGRRANERMLERLIPDPVFRRQLQAFFEAHPNFAQRFPGGIVQFAQFAGQLPEEALEDLMIAEAAAAEQMGGRGMPGMMPGVLIAELTPPEDEAADGAAGAPPADVGAVAARREESDDEDEDENEDEDEDVAPMPVRLLRNVMNRFWGGGTAAQESSEDENAADGPLNDDAGVD
ncbi:transcriptional repressor TCF25-domain-containing protein [Amylocystis lapponica]|nr:transcriptional repressor TCF25-domain-containing protein [Amylocystis lapponica]